MSATHIVVRRRLDPETVALIEAWTEVQRVTRAAYHAEPFALADELTHCGRCRAGLHQQCTGWMKDPIAHVERACECVDLEHVEDMVPVGHVLSDEEWEEHRHSLRTVVSRAITGEHVHLTVAQRADAVRLLHAQGLHDEVIADRLHIHRRTVLEIRHRLGLPAHTHQGAPA